jgi:TorA maturation chaperone TorD
VNNAVESINLSDLIMSRMGTYSLLARLFRVEVDQLVLDQLQTTDFTATVDDADVAEGYALWQKVQQNTNDRTLQALAIDYVRTFVGSGQSSSGAAYPYESVYTSPMRLLMQDARDKVLEAYQSEGIVKAPDFSDPEDHLALELSFMVYLNGRAMELFGEGKNEEGLSYLRKQLSFLTEHLLNWVPTLCSDIPRFAKEDLYLGLAKVTRGFLYIDRQVLTDLIQELSLSAA